MIERMVERNCSLTWTKMSEEKKKIFSKRLVDFLKTKRKKMMKVRMERNLCFRFHGSRSAEQRDDKKIFLNEGKLNIARDGFLSRV